MLVVAEGKQRKLEQSEIDKNNAYQYHKDRITSIEIVKDGSIQKVNFRILDQVKTAFSEEKTCICCDLY